jgi:pyruvate formate lyase activating enzyme
VRIGGLQQFSLSDFPGRVAAIVFTQGCNLACPFCHNGQLLPRRFAGQTLLSEYDVLEFLQSRRRQLEGIVVTGGEPTLQTDLLSFLRTLRALGFLVKLDTNGTRPDVLRRIFDEGLVDYVAMDVKAPFEKYALLTGVPIDTTRIAESIRRIAESGVDHEFRTTFVQPLLASEDLEAIRAMIPQGSLFRTQAFRPEHALDPALREGVVA